MQKPDAPTVLLCTDDYTAFCTRQALDQCSPQHPIVSIENSFFARQMALPGLAFDRVQLGRAAAVRLLKMLNVPVSASNITPTFWMQTDY
jgi:hypothetical protein